MIGAAHSTLNDDTRAALRVWYGARACDVDTLSASAHDGLLHASQIGVLSLGVDPALGGSGGTIEDMAETISIIASRCMTSAFVMWCHRMLISYISNSDNAFLIREVLPEIMSVRRLGATGLANAIKHAASLEELSVTARIEGDQVRLNGGIRWASNLVDDRFIIGIAAKLENGSPILIAVPAEAPGVQAGSHYPLVGLQGTCSSSLKFEDVVLDKKWVISWDLFPFIERVRPEFLVLQSGLGWGLAAAAFESIERTQAHQIPALKERLDVLHTRYQQLVLDVQDLSKIPLWDLQQKYRGLKTRKEIAELAVEAVWLELEAAGGRAYMGASDTARRLRESAFLPVQSPSLVQLTQELQQLEREVA